MDMYAVLLDGLAVDTQLSSMRPEIAAGCLGGLFHYFTKLSGKRESAAARQQCRLDKEDFAAHFGPRHSCRYAGRQFFSCLLGVKSRGPQIALDLLGGDRHLVGQAFGYL